MLARQKRCDHQRGPPPAAGAVGFLNLTHTSPLAATFQCLMYVQPLFLCSIHTRGASCLRRHAPPLFEYFAGELPRETAVGWSGLAEEWAKLHRAYFSGEFSALRFATMKQARVVSVHRCDLNGARFCLHSSFSSCCRVPRACPCNPCLASFVRV